jgi:hypothetical protein
MGQLMGLKVVQQYQIKEAGSYFFIQIQPLFGTGITI